MNKLANQPSEASAKRLERVIHTPRKMSEKPTLGELMDRLEQAKKYYGGIIPHDAALAWSGYLAGLIEWDLISAHDYQIACERLPIITNENPAIRILLGYDKNE